ncbi:MAG TPA: alkaline phosphatase family protein [Frankiaceae bacterium]|nr:alkaline phosphatase family protein [Frankiaceae bacterium]
MSQTAHVVIFVQENHTTDNYFRWMRGFGANVAADWPPSPNPPAADHPHDRHAYQRWLTAQQSGGATPAQHLQFDTAADLPFYAYLAATGAFLENHCSGFGTNSTPNHLLVVGGQSPTLRNPPSNKPPPLWDMPSLPGHAGDHGLSWKVYSGKSGYPVEFYTQLKGSPNVVPSSQFTADAAAGKLPQLAMVWHDSPLDEHPTADVSLGMHAIWQAVDAVVQAGLWDSTVFLQTWDDWGGYDDHVATPNVEHTPDGVQLAYGPRVPLLVYGGHVAAGVDSRWCSHVSLPKTALQLLNLPALGVPRLDQDAGLADLVDPHHSTPPPPSASSQIQLPPAPTPTPKPRPTPTPPSGPSQPVGPILLRDGTTLPPPNDVPLRTLQHS